MSSIREKDRSTPVAHGRAVTVYTNTGSSQVTKGPMFEGQRFSQAQAATIGGHLRARLRDCTLQNRALIIVFCGSPTEPWLLDTLDTELKGFPRDLVNYLSSGKGQGPSTAVRPSYDDEKEEFSFLLNYLSASQTRTEHNVPTMNFDDGMVTIHGVAAQILSASRLDRQKHAEEPMIVLWLASLMLLPLLDKHLGGLENSWRMNRLLHCPLWIYMDLFQACGDWPGVWDVARRDLARRDAQAYEDSMRPSTLHLTRKLHRATSNVITLREDLRLHIASFKRIRDHITKGSMGPWPSGAPFKGTLIERVADSLDDLNHHWETSEVILQQYNSVLSLVFNTETVAQGLAVARLNILAFAFLPLSFVAGIFGMTTFSTSAIWYPLWAFVALIAVVTVAYIVGKLSGESSTGPYSFIRQHFKGNHKHQPDQPLPYDGLSREGAIVPAAVSLTTETPPTRPGPPPGRWDSVRNRRPSHRARRITEREERLRKSAPHGPIPRPPASTAPEVPVPAPDHIVPDTVSDDESPSRSNYSRTSDSETESPVAPQNRLSPTAYSDIILLRARSSGRRVVQRGVTLLPNGQDSDLVYLE
ncbi:hypothetical protein BDW74DRAFT_181141 [Aspergillus multicolor]|uniref:uncharacterized protein n=1 Tax=Aspergillus multicolor TaxID=41759 RepID=UPI003CCD4F1C